MAPFILQKFKKILRADPELWGWAIFGPKMAHLSWKNFFLVQTIIITFIYVLALLIGQNGPFAPKKFFWGTLLKSFSFTYFPHSLCKILKKILSADPELWGCATFGPKMAHFLKWEFFSKNLLMSLVSFIHAYLHAKNQSQILIY